MSNASGELELTIQGSRLTANLVPPKVSIDGIDHDTEYGSNAYPLAPGRHRVRVWSPWMHSAGEATTEVDVPEGGVTRLYYAAPAVVGGAGRIGPAPHSRPGVRLMGLLVGAVVLLLVVLIIGQLLAG